MLARWCAMSSLALLGNPAFAEFKLTCPSEKQHKIKEQQSPSYEQTMVDGVKEKFQNAKVDCHSCYRSPEEQRAACLSICGKESCPSPNNCAAPGQSNHQKVSTCDIKGLPGNAQKGCDFLFEMCQTMRAQDSSLGCEIGGYGAGAHHLAVGKGIRNSAYTECKHLKPKMGSDPSAFAKQKERGDDLYNQVMNPSGGTPMAAGAPASSPSHAQPARRGPDAAYPTRSKSPLAASSDGDRKLVDIDPSLAAGKRGTADPFGPSDITKRTFGSVGAFENKGDLGALAGGSGRFGDPGSAKLAPGGSSGSGGSPSHLAAPSAPGADSGGAPSAGRANKAEGMADVLSSYSGAKGAGSLGAPKMNVNGSETESVVKGLAKDFGVDLSANARIPASDSANPAASGNAGVGEQDGDSLFQRCHAAYVRSIRGGRVH